MHFRSMAGIFRQLVTSMNEINRNTSKQKNITVITNAAGERIEVFTFQKQANLSPTQIAAPFTVPTNCVAEIFT